MYSHIVHLADIHIRTNRQDEYLSVFKNLFKSIKAETTTPLILLCGDIIHNKARITPEVIKLTNFLLDGLANIGKVILISGNHDLNENNGNREKFLEVLNKHSNIDYLSKSAEYVYNNVTVGASTLDDKKLIAYHQIKNRSQLTVAMGHFMLKEVGLPGYDREVSDFEGYDYVFLGDIHQRSQYKNCIYSGSLIQQNHSESLAKGYGILDISTRKYRYQDISNDYSFVTLKVDNKTGKLIIPDHPFTKHSTVRIFRGDKYRMEDDTYLAEIRKLTNIVDYTIDEYKHIKQSNETIQDVSILDIDDDEVILSELLDDSPLKDEILAQHRSYKHEGFSCNKNTKKFHIKSINFKNIFNYTTEQSLDLTNLKGLLGISGRNASGKSNILRVIIFALCGDISVDYSMTNDDGKKAKTQLVRCNKKYDYENSNIINRHTNECMTSIVFVHGNDTYRVKRVLKETPRCINASVNFDILKDDMWVQNNGHNKKDTDLEIHRLVGKSTIFLLLNVYNKYTSSLVSCSPQERYNILSTLLHLNIYVSIHDKVYEDLRELNKEKSVLEGRVSQLTKDINDIDLVLDIDQAEKEIISMEEDISILQKSYTPHMEPGEATDLDPTVSDITEISKDTHDSILKLQKKLLNLEPGEVAEKRLRKQSFIYEQYEKLKFAEPAEGEIVQLNNPPPACQTGVTSHMVHKAKLQTDEYNYDTTDTNNRDELITLLSKFNKKYIEIKAIKSKQDLDINLLSSITQPTRYPDMDKEQVLKAITSHVPSDIDKLQDEIDTMTIPTKIIIKPKRPVTCRDDLRDSNQLSIQRVYDHMRIDEILKDLHSKAPKKYVIEKVQRLKNIDQIILDVAFEVTQTNQLLAEIDRNTMHNEQIDRNTIHNEEVDTLIIKKQQMVKTLKYKKLQRQLHAQYVQQLERIKHNEYLDTLEPQFVEICRRLTFLDRHKKYVNLLYKFEQNVSYNIEQHEKYLRLQDIMPELRYHNNNVEEKIKCHKKTLSDTNSIIDHKTRVLKQELTTLTQRVSATKRYNESHGSKEKLEELTRTVSIKTEYQKLLSKGNGIQDYIISKYLKNMSDHINNYLKDLVSYEMSFVMSNNTVKLDIIKKGLTLHPSQLSGYEGFIADVVTKMVINRYTQVGSSQFFAIDEGMGVIDSENFEKFTSLLNQMKKHYKNILIISHIDEVNNLVTHKVEVKHNKLVKK